MRSLPRVGDVHVFAGDRDAAARGLGRVLEEPKSNSPSSLPVCPQAVMNSPEGLNFSIRLCSELTT